MLALMLAIATVTVDVALLAVVAGTVLPLLTATFAKLKASPGVKKALGALLALLAGAVACLVANDGTVQADQLALASFMALLASDKSYDYLWKTLGTFQAVQAKTAGFGVGSTGTPNGPETDT